MTTDRTWTLADVIARIQQLATDGTAPSVRTWNQRSGHCLPGYETLMRHGYAWPALVKLAGLEPAKRGGRPGNTNASGAQRAASGATVDAEVKQMFDTAEPPRPRSWPLFGIPTRTEVIFGQLPDGTPVRVTRQYYSLR